MNKVILSFTFGVIVTIGVYFALENSLSRPSLNRLPIPEETAKSIVIRLGNISSLNLNNLEADYVYIRSNGSIYRSSPENNNILEYLDSTDSTITGGNHFSWRIKDNLTKSIFFVDHVTGEIVSKTVR